ncbi:MAG: GerMN domain-containing protein [Rectinema sp.]
MAVRRKKRTSAKAGCLLWIVALVVLLILFLVKFEDIRSVVQKTGFLDALNHAVSKPTTVQTSEPSGSDQQTSPQETAPAAPVPQTPSSPQTTAPAPSPTDSGQTAPPSTSEAPSEQVPEPSPSQTPMEKARTVALYFIQIHDDGSISTQRVKRTIPLSDSPMQDTLEILLEGPTESELRANLLSLIPSGTKLRGVSVKGSTAIVDFNDAFGYNRYGKEGYIAQLKQIVYTLTEFQNIKDVQFLIEGKTRAFLSEGVALDTPLSRSSF